MSAAEVSLAAFAFCNALRIVAYLPQMLKIIRHPQGAAGFSYATWTLFAAANASTALYAGATLRDTALASVHALSALCCGVLLALAAWRNGWPVRLRPAAHDALPAALPAALPTTLARH